MATHNRDEFWLQLQASLKTIIGDMDGDRYHALRTFAERFFERLPLDEMAERPMADIAGMVHHAYSFMQEFDRSQPKLQLLSPSDTGRQWQAPHTSLLVLQQDMPFLVDSVRLELNRRDINVYTIKSTVLDVVRSGAELVDVQPETPSLSGHQSHKEALLYIEISRYTSDEQLQDLLSTLHDILADVDAVVVDYKKMLAKTKAVQANFALISDDVNQSHLEECDHFIQWLMSNHFTFLGYAEFDLIEKDGSTVMVENEAERLGLFTRHNKHYPPLPFDQFSEGMERFHLVPQAITFSKSSMRSRVHRSAYSDYVIFKRYSADGKVAGECRLMGLYTSPVYTLSPTHIPIVRGKITQIIERSGLDPWSHDGKALQQVIEAFPRDELFQGSCSELFEIITRVAEINERHMVRLFMRKDAYNKFVSAIVYIPKDIFSTRIREKIQHLIGSTLQAQDWEFNTFFSESILARVYLVFKVDESKPVTFDVDALQQQVIELTHDWADNLLRSLIASHGEKRARELYRHYATAFSSGYMEYHAADEAVHDIDTVDALLCDNAKLKMRLHRTDDQDQQRFTLNIFHRNTLVELSSIVPILENMGLKVLGEHPYKIKPRLSVNSETQEQDTVWLQAFDVRFTQGESLSLDECRHRFEEAFIAVWSKQARNDSFNRLVLSAGLQWREVLILRAYAAYMKQIQFTFSQSYIANTLVAHSGITQQLVAVFHQAFAPTENNPKPSEIHTEQLQALKNDITQALESVSNLSEDRIIRRYLEVISATLRTNFYQSAVDDHSAHKDYLSFKLSPRTLNDIPEPKPLYEVFVYSVYMEGVHLRGGKVARGGLRWSDRLQDYRTEVLGLVKAQQVKNAVIVPNGAKGGFVVKRPPTNGGREAFMEEGIRCYKTFIRGLLDITDNLHDGSVVPPKQVVRYDKDDPYLVVAADKGTATFSDIANGISAEYNHWLGDAFASGGSQGYDHKGMGITAKGAWVSVQRHFKELGLNTQKDEFTVVGVGDMAGDVFGNGMLLSDKIRLVAAFNHLHIFIDPNPDAASSFVERERLFNTPRTSWEDYNAKLISKGGGVFSRSLKSIAITPEMQERFAIEESSLTPAELMHRLLQAPVDLLWNGGIGTYVKSRQETHAQIGDKANDSVRVNGEQLRCRVIGEGGNLGMSQRGRVEYCLQGGRCNTDFIDNAAGVDCSDHEVNIKILLNELLVQNELTQDQRNQLLVDMTENVSALVLKNNYRQTQAISIAAYEVNRRVGEYCRFMNAFEQSGRLNRELEFLPDDDTINERPASSQALTRPELSVLISYAKAALKEQLANSDVPEDAYLAASVSRAFPAVLHERYASVMQQHRLRREIVATQIANNMVNLMGINFCQRLMESTGTDAGQVAKAFVAARDIYQLEDLWQRIEDLDYTVTASVQFELMLLIMRRVRRATRWLLRNRRSHLEPAAEVQRFRQSLLELAEQVPHVLTGVALESKQQKQTGWVNQGVPKELAEQMALPSSLYSGLGMVEAALQTDKPIKRVVELYYQLGDFLQLHWFFAQITDAPVGNYWQAMARETFMDDLEWQLRTIAVSLLQLPNFDSDEVSDIVHTWSQQQDLLIGRWKTMVSELQAANHTDFAIFSVALRELLDLAQATAHFSQDQVAAD